MLCHDLSTYDDSHSTVMIATTASVTTVAVPMWALLLIDSFDSF